jgi:penicillin-binding protein 1C
VRAFPERMQKAVRRFIERKRRILLRSFAALAALPFVLVGTIALFTPLPPELRERASPSLRVTSRSGRLLREVRADDGARARPLPLSAFPSRVRDAVLAAEDRRFHSHVGVDPLAITRAAAGSLWHRRIVSGASTLTMQLARTVRPHPRSLWGKLREMGLAVRIEASLSKDEILEQYLNRVVYGPNLRGYAAASHAYFGAEPASLSLAEATLIAGLPRGPSLYALGKGTDRARRRRDRVLTRMADAGVIDEGAKERAVAEPIAVAIDRPARGAPHLVRGLALGTVTALQPGLGEALSDRAALSEIRTTIDDTMQRTAEAAVASTVGSLHDRDVTAGAVLVLDNASGDVLAWVGSPDFFDAPALGQNDGVVALRQPGSALKPFVYAEAMDRLGFTGATALPDVDLHIPLPGGGDYVPHDYDGKLRGPVRLREALGSSLNVPAVYTTHRMGTGAVLDRLRAMGFASLREDAEHYGPALALGDGEVTLFELANAYATLARGGRATPARFVTQVVRGDVGMDFPPAASKPVLDEKIAAMLTDILADKRARMSAFGDQNVLELEGEVAAKTGTSKGFRDNVAVGYTRETTVAVWVGNFDGSPMRDVSGITGAGPILRAVLDVAIARTRSPAPLAVRPSDAARLGLARTAVCALSGEIATSACPHRVFDWLPVGERDHAPTCNIHVQRRIDGELRVFEQWADPYREWAARLGRPELPVEPPLEPPTGKRIVQPFDGARFAIDPERPPALQKLAVSTHPPNAAVRVDGVPIGEDHMWPLVPGDHRIEVDGHAVSIHVH